MKNESTFGDRLKALRVTRNMSQEEFASLLNTSKQVISRYETNQRVPKITVVQEYSEKLSTPLDYLLTGDSFPLQEQGSSQFELSEEHKELIDLYDQLIEADKQAAMQNIRGLLAYRAMEKKYNPPVSDGDESDLVG